MSEKKDRQKIFDKYGGRCAYCGCELQKGWHVDEIEPVRRRWKTIKGHWALPDGTPVKSNSFTEDEGIERGIRWRDDRTVPDGYDHPERLTIENQNPACASCNINKHSAPLESFRALIAGFTNSLNRDSVQYKMAKRYGLVQETKQEVVFYFEKHKPNQQ